MTFVNKNPRSNKSYLNLNFLSLNKLSVFIVPWASPGCSGNLLEICHVKDSKESIFQPPGPDFCLMRCYSTVLRSHHFLCQFEYGRYISDIKINWRTFLVLEPNCEIFIKEIGKLNTTKYVVLCSAAYNNIISIVNPQNGH